MNQNTQTFRPRYELHPHTPGHDTTDAFVFNNTCYKVKNGMFSRMTTTQKEVLEWLLRVHARSAPPMSISHEKPTTPDHGIFYSKETFHVREVPYAMVGVTVHFAGDKEPKLLMVYFCNGESFNPETKTLWTIPSVRISFTQ